MSTYVDSALFVKSYIYEVDSRETIALLDSIEPPHHLSPLHELEILNAIRLKHFRGEITMAQEKAAAKAFREDLQSGFFEPITGDLLNIFIRAEKLSAAYSSAIGSRSLDLWHIAAAMELKCGTFVSYDHRQRTVAAKAGLRVLPKTRFSKITA